jgi:hypothetical protein
MNHGLEKAVAKANQTLTRHRIILGVDDRGKLSCHKTHLCFIYFDTTDCVVSIFIPWLILRLITDFVDFK